MSKAYFAREALSNTGIKKIIRSPKKFRHWANNPNADSSDYRIGRGVHNLVLEPENPKILVFHETKTFQSKAGELFLSQNPMSICLTVEEHLTVLNITDSIFSNDPVSRLLKSCPLRELEIYGKEPTTFGSIESKAMVDAMNDGLILDLKTTKDDCEDFEWNGRKKFRYDIQAAWYRHMAEKHYDGKLREFCFIVVEKNPPYEIKVYQTKPETFSAGWSDCEHAIDIYAACKLRNLWPARDTNIVGTF